VPEDGTILSAGIPVKTVPLTETAWTIRGTSLGGPSQPKCWGALHTQSRGTEFIQMFSALSRGAEQQARGPTCMSSLRNGVAR